MGNCTDTRPSNQNQGEASEIPDAIWRNFKYPMRRTTSGGVNFKRVIRLDICPGGANQPFDLTVERWDIDFSEMGDIFEEWEQIMLAKYFYDFMWNDSDSLCKPKYPAFDELYQIFMKNNLAEGLQAKTVASSKVINKAKSSFLGGWGDYRPVKSKFDIRFSAETAVIFRSNIRHLHFMPEPFIFRNPRDQMYYRQEDVSIDFTKCRLINAWDSGAAANRLPRDTPYNQEHKIDLSMVLSVWDDCSKEWLMTPITIDPPVENGGKGPPPNVVNSDAKLEGIENGGKGVPPIKK